MEMAGVLPPLETIGAVAETLVTVPPPAGTDQPPPAAKNFPAAESPAAGAGTDPFAPPDPESPVKLLMEIAGVLPPLETIGPVPETLVTVPPPPPPPPAGLDLAERPLYPYTITSPVPVPEMLVTLIRTYFPYAA